MNKTNKNNKTHYSDNLPTKRRFAKAIMGSFVEERNYKIRIMDAYTKS